MTFLNVLAARLRRALAPGRSRMRDGQRRALGGGDPLVWLKNQAGCAR